MWPRRIALAVLLAALVAPLFLTTIPPLLDYPNHLARMRVLLAAGHDPALASIYAIDWHIVPNLGMDAVVPLLAKLMPLDIAGRLFIALALILPVLGTVALHDAVFEKRSWWPLVLALAVYNATLLAGFLNFMVGTGLALLGAACWIRLKDRPFWQQSGAVAVIAIPAFFTHLFGVAFLFLIVSCFELNEIARERRVGATVGRAAKLALTVLPVAMLYLQTRIASDAGGSPLVLIKNVWWSLTKFDPLTKAIGAAADFMTYDTHIDLMILGAIATVITILAITRRLRLSWLSGLAAALFGLYPFIPSVLSETGWIDIRFPVLAGFLFFAGIAPRKLARREIAALAFVVVALIATRVGVIATTWQGQNANIADLESVLQPVKALDRVLVVTAPKASPNVVEPVRWKFFVNQASFGHSAAPMIVERGAFYPHLFTTAAKQPLHALAPYDKLSEDRIVPPSSDVLSDHPPATTSSTAMLVTYLADWQKNFDYVLVLAADRLVQPKGFYADRLDFIAATPTAALYRVHARAQAPALTAQLSPTR